MRILIDTQILIWYQLNHPRLNRDVFSILSDSKNQVFISDISLYEIAIKQKIGKLPGFEVQIRDIITVAEQDDFRFIPLTHEHLINYDTIPMMEDHRDPFDRLIVATAKAEDLAIISADNKFTLYKSYIRLIEA